MLGTQDRKKGDKFTGELGGRRRGNEGAGGRSAPGGKVGTRKHLSLQGLEAVGSSHRQPPNEIQGRFGGASGSNAVVGFESQPLRAARAGLPISPSPPCLCVGTPSAIPERLSAIGVGLSVLWSHCSLDMVMQEVLAVSVNPAGVVLSSHWFTEIWRLKVVSPGGRTRFIGNDGRDYFAVGSVLVPDSVTTVWTWAWCVALRGRTLTSMGYSPKGAGPMAGDLPARMGPPCIDDVREPDVIRMFQFPDAESSQPWLYGVYRNGGAPPVVCPTGCPPEPVARPKRAPAPGDIWPPPVRARSSHSVSFAPLPLSARQVDGVSAEHAPAGTGHPAPPVPGVASSWTRTSPKPPAQGITVRERRRAAEMGLPVEDRLPARLHSEGPAAALSGFRYLASGTKPPRIAYACDFFSDDDDADPAGATAADPLSPPRDLGGASGSGDASRPPRSPNVGPATQQRLVDRPPAKRSVPSEPPSATVSVAGTAFAAGTPDVRPPSPNAGTAFKRTTARSPLARKAGLAAGAAADASAAAPRSLTPSVADASHRLPDCPSPPKRTATGAPLTVADTATSPTAGAEPSTPPRPPPPLRMEHFFGDSAEERSASAVAAMDVPSTGPRAGSAAARPTEPNPSAYAALGGPHILPSSPPMQRGKLESLPSPSVTPGPLPSAAPTAPARPSGTCKPSAPPPGLAGGRQQREAPSGAHDDASWAPSASPVGATAGFRYTVWHAGLGTIVSTWDKLGGRLVAAVEESAPTRRRLPPGLSSCTYSSTQDYVKASLGSVDCIITQPDASGATPSGLAVSSTQAFSDLASLAAVRPAVFVAVHAPDFVTRGKRATWNRYCRSLGLLGYVRRGAKLVSAADLGGKVDSRRLVAFFTTANGLPVLWASPRAGPDAVAVRAAFDEPHVDTNANVRHPRGRGPWTVPRDFQRLPPRTSLRSRPRQIGFFGSNVAGSRVYSCEHPIPQPSDECEDDFFASEQWSPGANDVAWYLCPRSLSVSEELRVWGFDPGLLLPGPVAAVKALIRRELPTVTAVWAGESMLPLLHRQVVAAVPPPPSPSERFHEEAEPLPRPTAAGSCSRRDLAKLVGHLQYVSKAMPRHGYLRPLYDALNGTERTSWDCTDHIGKHLLYGPGGKPRYDVDVPLNNVFWDALADLNVVLAKSDGVYVMRASGVVIHQGYGDASPSGAGLVDVDADGCVSYRAGTWNVAEAARTSNWKELRTVLSRLEEEVRTMRRSGASKYNGCVLYACTDNSTTAYAAESGTSTSRRLLELVRRLRLAEATLRCQVIVVWISGKRIIQSGADGASRGAVGEGLTGSGDAARLFNSPISHPGLFPSNHLLQALKQAFPEHQLLLQPDEWVNRTFDRPVVIVACNSTAVVTTPRLSLLSAH